MEGIARLRVRHSMDTTVVRVTHFITWLLDVTFLLITSYMILGRKRGLTCQTYFCSALAFSKFLYNSLNLRVRNMDVWEGAISKVSRNRRTSTGCLSIVRSQKHHKTPPMRAIRSIGRSVKSTKTAFQVSILLSINTLYDIYLNEIPIIGLPVNVDPRHQLIV